MQYIQIKEAIAEQINSGMLTPKQKLPAERQLAQSFATTRITLREALSLLEAEGIIYREDRRGWFISPKPLNYYSNQNIDFHKNAKLQQKKPKIEPVKAHKTLANKEATILLSLPPFSNIYHIDRIYYLDESPVAFARHYILPAKLPDLLSQDLTRSLTEIYCKHYQINCVQNPHKFYTSSFVGEIAEALRTTNGAPSTVIEHAHHSEQHKLIDYSIEYWRHNSIAIELKSKTCDDKS